jgi:histidine triad (HIT) family protein
MNPDCLFCKILNEEIPADIVYSDDELLAFNDVNPQAPTHVLIIPKTHIATVNDLTEAQSGIIAKMILCAKTLAGETGIAESGYRLVMNCNDQGGQTVFHIHLHLMGGRPLRALG